MIFLANGGFPNLSCGYCIFGIRFNFTIRDNTDQEHRHLQARPYVAQGQQGLQQRDQRPGGPQDGQSPRGRQHHLGQWAGDGDSQIQFQFNFHKELSSSGSTLSFC